MSHASELIEQSVAQGLDFLEVEKPELLQFILPGSPVGAAARRLEDEINQGIGHSGSSADCALRSLFAIAQRDLNYSLTLSEGASPHRPQDAPLKIATLTLKS